MKKIVLFILIAIVSDVFSQEKGIIKYKKINHNHLLDTLKENSLYKRNKPLYDKLILVDIETKRILKTLRYTLKFDRQKSLFKVEKSLELEGDMFLDIAIGPYGSGVYYNNILENKYYTQLDAFGEVFLIKTLNPKWVTLTESKKIGNYTCYKATTVKKIKGRNGILNYPVTAWFCPELSFSYGPLGYGGLPGLILELELNNEKYIVDKIEINPDKKVIVKKPNSGIKITKEEFEEIGIKTMNNYKKSIGN